ncbi:hypothetical protein AVEN_94659-1 [Araneus ventricosus]|uniref:Uncharacterized protein n=1 Tax=Araneus ventricosus TaxID=182803 RepID=A0A4Y2WPV9_ARAVE|nr:hypothetical protein AVEN_94659-1 [Araneus ventricosus]
MRDFTRVTILASCKPCLKHLRAERFASSWFTDWNVFFFSAHDEWLVYRSRRSKSHRLLSEHKAIRIQFTLGRVRMQFVDRREPPTNLRGRIYNPSCIPKIPNSLYWRLIRDD